MKDIRVIRHEYYMRNRERLLQYHKEWRKKNPDKYNENKDRINKRVMENYVYKRGPNRGYFVYNDNQELFFNTVKEVRDYLGCSYRCFRLLMDGDLEINGYHGERAI